MKEPNDKIKLRLLERKDTDITWQWRNQKDVQDHFSGHPYAVTREQEMEWFDKQVKDNSSILVFGIELLSDSRLVGMTFLKHINQIHRQAEFAILIDQDFIGKGFGKEACYKTLEHAFAELNLHRVFLKVRADNPAAIKIYEHCGFRMEGELKDDVFKNGSFRNQWIMAVLASEFNTQGK